MKADHSAEPAASAVRDPVRNPERNLVLAGVAATAVGIAFVADPATIEDGPVICPFRHLTGLPCPGCGLTRSWVYLAHGEWADAWSANPFGIAAMLLAVLFVAVVGWTMATRRPGPDLTAMVRSTPFLLFGAAWVVFGVVRVLVLLA